MKRIITFLLLGGIQILGGDELGTDNNLRITDLRCEYRARPLGVDVKRPRLSWILESDKRGQRQTAYQVLVASSEEHLSKGNGDLWDTGKVESDQSIQVEYGGKPLSSARRCYWKVRVWDRDGKPSAYSETAWWEMGLLDPADWSAQWITICYPADFARPSLFASCNWIWHKKIRNNEYPNPIYIRRVFPVTSKEEVSSARIKLTGAGHRILYLNGQKIGEGRLWKRIDTFDLSPLLVEGDNAIAVEAMNGGGPFGLLALMQIDYKDGRKLEVVSDPEWRLAPQAEDNWQEARFNDSGWENAAVLGRYGDDPWGWCDIDLPPPTRRALCFRKEFNLPVRFDSARAYVSGLGCYELRINGQRVGNDIFAPGWTGYRNRVQYQTYDVTNLLKQGFNCIAAIAGSGWWNSMDGRGGKKPRLIVQLCIKQNGKRIFKVVTDKSWKAHVSPIIEDAFYFGESYDARLEMKGWDGAGFNDSNWRPIEVLKDSVNSLIAQQCQTIQVTDELSAVRITEPTKGVCVFDFGQNASGNCRLKVCGAERGTRIQIRHAEVLESDGNIHTNNYGKARSTDVYICTGDEEETWEPRFTYRGFRYAELTGYPGKPGKDALIFRVFHSTVPQAGKFECSNPLINRIWRNITWSQRSNMHSAPTDCPQRDERFAWTGDSQVFAHTACWNMDMSLFYAKWMRDIIFGGPYAGDGPGWADARIVVPWTLYCFYADKRIIEESYNEMVSLIKSRQQAAAGSLYESEGFGDWLAVVPSPQKPIGSGYYYYSVKLLSQMAEVIGKTMDAKEYSGLAEQIARAFNAAYLDEKNNLYPGGTQASMVLPLYFGLVPPERRKAVEANLVKDIVDRQYHLSTGFLGTAYLLPVLSLAGKDEVAFRLAAQKTYPSWGYMVEQEDATTIWEFWHSDKTDPTSRNHFALGAVGRWFFESLAGINNDPLEPGFKHIIIQPGPVGDLRWARAEYRSMYGLIRSAWKIKEDVFWLELIIPANTRATVHIPAIKASDVTEGGRPAIEAEMIDFVRMENGVAVFQVGSGSYAFESRGLSGVSVRR